METDVHQEQNQVMGGISGSSDLNPHAKNERPKKSLTVLKDKIRDNHKVSLQCVFEVNDTSCNIIE